MTGPLREHVRSGLQRTTLELREEYSWSYGYYRASEGFPPRAAFAATIGEMIGSRLSRLGCRLFGHIWQGTGYATPDSGGDGAECLACGESWDVTYY